MPGIVKIAFLADVGAAKVGLTQFSSDVDKTVGKAGESWGKLKDKLKIGALAGGAAIGAGLAAGLDFQAVQSKLSAQLGLTGPAAAKVGKAAGDLYKNGFGDSVEGAADIVKAAFQNGVVGINDSREAIQGVGADIANYITLTGEDAQKTTEAVAQILKNKLAPNAKAAFDLLAKGQELGVNKAEDLLDTFNEYSTQFRALGLEGPAALGLMSQGLKAGARDADTVADSLKEFAIRAKDGSKTTVDGFKSLGLSAEGMQKVFAKGGPGAAAGLDQVLDKLRLVKDPAEQSRIAVELFGTKAEDMQAALLKLDPSTAVAGLGNLAGAADRAGATLNDNAKARLTSFKRALGVNIVGFIGNNVIPALDSLGQGVSEKLGPVFTAVGTAIQTKLLPGLKSIGSEVGGKAVTAANNLKTAFGPLAAQLGPAIVAAFDKLKPAIAAVGEAIRSAGDAVVSFTGFLAQHQTTVGAVAVAIGAITLALGIYKAAMLAAAIATKAVAAVQAVLNVVLSANPIGIIVLAIIGLVAALVYAYKNSETFRRIVDSTFKAIKTVVLSVVGAVVSFVKSTWSKIGPFIMAPIQIALAVVKTVFPAMRATISAVVGFVAGYIRVQFAIIKTAITVAVGIVKTIGAAFSAAKAAVVAAVKAIIEKVQGIRSAITGALSGAGSWLQNAGRKIIQGLLDGIESMIGSVKSKLQSVTGLIPDWKGPLDKDKRLLTPAGKAIMGSLISGIDSQLPALRSMLGRVSGQIETGLSASPSVALAGASGGRLGPGGAGGVVVNVYALTAGPEVGKATVDAIKEYERFNGTSWRAVPA
jgi:phage-related minor tail protein